jgi:general secretion pathway protein D
MLIKRINMKRNKLVTGISLLFCVGTLFANDPTAAPEKLADEIKAQLTELQSFSLGALVCGQADGGVAIVVAPNGKTFFVRPSSAIQYEYSGVPIKLNIKSITAEGVQLEAPTLNQELWIGTSYKLASNTTKTEAAEACLTHVEANNFELGQLVRLLSEQIGVNISASQKAAKIPISIFLRNVPINVVVEELCRAHNLWYRADEKTGIVRITTMPEYEGSLQTFREEQTRTFTLLYPNVVEIASVIYGLYPERVYLTLGENDILDDELSDLSRRFERLEMIDSSSSSSFLAIDPGNISVRGSSTDTFNSSDNHNRNISDDYSNKESFGGMSPEAAAQLEAARGNEAEFRKKLDLFRNQSPSIFVTISRKNNIMIVRTSDPKVMDEIADLIKKLDVATPSVMLEMKIVQVTLDDEFNSTFEYEIKSENTVNGNLYSSMAGFPGFNPLANTPRTDSFSYSLISDKFSARIQLLEKDGKAKVIATPTLLIANNEVSRIFIGEEKPITTGVTMEPVMGTIDGMTSTIGYTVEPQIEMTPIGTTLVIAPNINADRSVMLRLMQEESSVRKNGGSIPYGNASSLQTYSVDTIQSRRISGTFITQDGLLAGIGGLITETESEQISRVPILGHIPLIGFLFRSTEIVKQRSELIILIRPHVICTPLESERATNELLQRVAPKSVEVLTNSQYTAEESPVK